MEMNGSFGPIFQSSSSSTTQQNSDSSPGLLMNMMDGHMFQDDQKKPLCGLLDIPRSDIDYTTHHDIDEANNKELVTVSGKKKAAGETKKCKKPRYAFQTRSQVDILDDGYRWRKYGQKAVKNNKFPRSYYRCTYQGCNVKKQIQRLSKDEGIVVTTYDGMHSHAIEKSTDNFEHILTQMQIYTSV